MKLRTTLCLALFSAFTCGLLAQSAAAPAAVPRIVAPISESHLTSLRGNISPLAHTLYDRGPAPVSNPTGRILLVLQRSSAQQQALTQYLSGLQNPASPTYHKWLTPAQYGTQFGVDPSDIQTVESWLQSHGLRIDAVPASRNIIEFSGSIDQVQRAFHTSIHSFSVHGLTRYANVTNPQIPAALAPVIAGIGPLNNFRPHPDLQMGPTGRWNSTTHSIQPNLTLFGSNNTPYLFVDPSDAAVIYDTPNSALNPGFPGTTYTGSGITIGIVGESNLPASSAMQDILNYRTAFLGEIAANVNLPTVIVDGNDPGLVPGGAAVEALLDNEVAGGLAPGAKIDYYTSAGSNLTDGLINAIARAIDDNTVDILSISFGACEAALGSSGNQLVDELAQQAAAQGITVTVSAGDGGSAGCDDFNTAAVAQDGLAVNGFASTPYTVAVGGTDFDVLGNSFSTYVATTTDGAIPYYLTAKSYIPEEPWNDSTTTNGSLSQNSAYKDSNGNTNIVAGSGGVSSVYAKPAFQQSVTPPDGHRDLPDVSFFAANGSYGAMWVLCADPVSEQNSNASSNTPDCQNTGGQFSSATNFSGVGGTSAATPAFAGMLALVEQKVGGRLGQVDPVLYQLDQSHSSAFHDVVNGNNSVPCASGSPDCGSNGFLTGYNAAAGYDLASGLGSVDVAALASDWSSAHFASTSTTLQINSSPSSYSGVHGATVTFNVGVTPTSATGPVAILDDANTTSGGTASGPQNDSQITIPLTSGAGSATYNGLPGGSYTVWANYGGDTSTTSSQSTPIHVNITPEASTTVLTVNAYNPQTGSSVSGSAIPYGSVLYANAQIEGKAEGSKTQGAATGKVTFSLGSSTLGTATIDSGDVASWPPPNAKLSIPSPGTYNYAASYSGDSSFNSSTSSTVPVTIAKAVTTFTTTNPPSTVSNLYSGGTISLSFTIQTPYTLGAAPTGSLTVTANGHTADTESLSPGTAQGSGDSKVWLISTYANVPDNLFQPGANTITLSYSGDANYAPSSQTITIKDTDGIGSFTMTGSGDVPVVAGLTGDETLTFSPSGGFDGMVGVTVSTPPAGVQVWGGSGFGEFGNGAGSTFAFSSAATADLHIVTQFTATPGTYPITVTASDVTGKIVRTVTFNVVVQPLPANAGLKLTNGGPASLAADSKTKYAGSVTLTPVNGFIGSVNFTCAITPLSSSGKYTPECQGFSQDFPNSTAAILPVPIVTNMNTTPGTYTETVTATDANNSAITAKTSFTLTITPYSGVTLSSSNDITVNPGATTGNTSTITISPTGGFTGVVDLSCSVTLSTSGYQPGCSIPSSVTITGASPVTATLTANTPSYIPLGNYDIYVTATEYTTGRDDSDINVKVKVQAAPEIALSNSGNISVPAGATTGNTPTVTVTPSNGFTGAVNLTCKVTTSLTNPHDPPTCSVPSSVTISGTKAATATVTVTTTASTTSDLHFPLTRLLLGGGGATLAMVLFFGIPARRGSWRTLFSLLVVIAISGAIGCGGGGATTGSTGSTGGSGGSGGGGTTTVSGTTPGAYTVTVTGKDAATGQLISITSFFVQVTPG